jgi:XTP/dITP diphosphohydrolase
MRIALCTGNPGKVEELRALLPRNWEVVGLKDLGLPLDLPEDGDTLEANALQKARYAHVRCGLPCLADDTGLEVLALGGAPGVRSARYAGEAKDATANMVRLLREMERITERGARFRTVLALVRNSEERLFEGTVEGAIALSPRGSGGFGYDPLFVPQGSELTFAEMDAKAKNAMSHRARAMEQLRVWAARIGS